MMNAMFRFALIAVAFGAAGLAHAQDYNQKPNFGTFNLESGSRKPDDPLSVRVIAGGGILTRMGGVASWVSNPPDVRLNYKAGTSALVFRVESNAETSLLINLPDGKWLASEKLPSNGGGDKNPIVRINQPQSGQYDIWVAMPKRGFKLPAATLLISEATSVVAPPDIKVADPPDSKTPEVKLDPVKKPAPKIERPDPVFKGTGSFAVAEVENRSSRVAIRYKLKWNDSEKWGDEYVLPPGASDVHSLTVPAGSQLPVAKIAFEKGIDFLDGEVTYDLETVYRTYAGDGKGYHFVVKTAENGRDYIALMARSRDQEAASIKLTSAIRKANEKDYVWANDLATSALALDPRSARGYWTRASIRYSAGEYDDALRDWANVLKITPKQPQFHLFRSMAFARKHRHDRVVDEATMAIELNRFLAEAYDERGAALWELLDFDNAAADFRKSLQIKPRIAPTLVALGKCLVAKEQYPAAIEVLNQAIDLAPKTWEGYAVRAKAFENSGESSKASVDMQTARQNGMPANYTFIHRFQDAMLSLDSYKLGQVVTPEIVRRFNLLNFEVDPKNVANDKFGEPLPEELRELIHGEWRRHMAMRYEGVAAANVFFKAAKMSEQELRAKGMELDWYYGPVTAPQARFRSGDDLGGLRVIGHLKMPDKKEISMIFALTFFPPTGENELDGKVGLLFDGDNVRMQMKLHNTGEFTKDYLFQGFGAVPGKDGKMSMRAAYNLDETSGILINKSLTPASMSTRCIHCHNQGFTPNAGLVEQLKITRKGSAEEVANIEEVKEFIKLAKFQGAGKQEMKKLEKQMIKGGPSSLLPIDDLYNANRQYWFEIYHHYLDWRRDPRPYFDIVEREEKTPPTKKKS